MNNDFGVFFYFFQRVLPTLKRLMRADTNIEKFLKTCPTKDKVEKILIFEVKSKNHTKIKPLLKIRPV